MASIPGVTTDLNPYPGPRPFRPEESDRFVGRETEARDLFSLITAHQAVLLYAQSGAGKSSLINAGLLPLLRDAGYDTLPAARVLAPASDRIDPKRIGNIFTFSIALHWLADPAETLERATLREAFDRVPRREGSLPDEPRVMIFDQFEEFFTAHQDRWRDREPFFHQLDELLDQDELARVIFVMREDYLAQLEPFAKLLTKQLRTRMRLERLGEDAALRAIVEPLAKTGRRFAPGAAEGLVGDLLRARTEIAPGQTVDVVGQHVEPVQLQLVCQSLWQTLGEGEDTVLSEHIKAIGDIDDILSSFYEEAVAAAAKKGGVEEREVREWVETTLITAVGTRGTVYRGPEMTGSVPNEVIDELEERHLIRAEFRAGARWYELTHDRFIEPIRSSNRAYLESNYRPDSYVAYELVTEAQELWRRRRREEAIELFRRALDHLDDNEPSAPAAYVLYALGSLLLEMGTPDQALPMLYRAAQFYQTLGRGTELAAVLGLIGKIASERGDYPQAIDFLSAALELTPGDELLLEVRGGAYWYSGDLEHAIGDYDDLLKVNGRNANAYSCRGQILCEIRRYEEAVSDLNEAIANASGERGSALVAAYALNGRGLAHGGLRQWDAAMIDFSASLAIAPDNAWAFFNRAVVHHRKGDERAAIADLRTSLQKTDPPLNARKRAEAEAILGGTGKWPS